MNTVTDTMSIAAPLDLVYEYCWHAEHWPKITPHVRIVKISEQSDVRQRIEMSVESDGVLHSVESTRTAVPRHLITYKQDKPPAFLAEHSGEWSFRSDNDTTVVTLIHRFEAREDVARRVLGCSESDNVVDQIGARLLRNGRLTLTAVKELLEQPRDRGAGSGSGVESLRS